jgi:hypothetical protein
VAPVAQRSERRAFNPGDASSNLAGGTFSTLCRPFVRSRCETYVRYGETREKARRDRSRPQRPCSSPPEPGSPARPEQEASHRAAQMPTTWHHGVRLVRTGAAQVAVQAMHWRSRHSPPSEGQAGAGRGGWRVLLRLRIRPLHQQPALPPRRSGEEVIRHDRRNGEVDRDLPRGVKEVRTRLRQLPWRDRGWTSRVSSSRRDLCDLARSARPERQAGGVVGSQRLARGGPR